MENSIDKKEQLKQLDSPDPAVRRESVESFLSVEIDENVAELLSKKLADDDKGVRDSVSSVLIQSSFDKVPFYVVPFVSSKDISVRNLAGEVLLRRGVNSIDAMLDYIPKGDDDDKKFVIDILGLIGDVRPEDEIIKVLMSNQNDNVLLACLEGLGNIKSEKSVEYIIPFYDKNELFRPTIIEALGKIGSADAVKFILEKYKEEDEVTQYSMIESLGKIGSIEAFFFLISELKNMSSALTWAAIKSLKELKDIHNLDVPFDENMKNSIMITLVDGDIEYKRAAASLISVFEDKKIVEACLKIYGEDSEIDEYIKAKFFENPVFLYPRLTEYMKQKPENIKSLFDLLKNIIEFNSDSLASLSEIDMRNLCDMFADNLENSDEEIRRNAIEFLFFCSLDMAEMFVDIMLQDDNFWNRLRVLEILEGLNSEKINEAATMLSEDPEEMVKEKALELLQRNGISNTESKV